MSTTHNRIFGLDLVRAFAILTVVYAHGSYLLYSPLRARMAPLNWLLSFDGVTVFFVLSGFLIGTILIKTLERDEATPRNLLGFMYKRWFRTLPLFYLVLSFLLIHALVTGENVEHSWRYLLFVQNIASPHPTFFPEAWSLAVEEWFYLLVPFSIFSLVGLAKLRPKVAVLLVFGVMVVAVTYMRYYKSQILGLDSVQGWDLGIRKQVVTRLDSISFGLLGAWMHYYYAQLWGNWKKVSFVLGLLLLVAVRQATYFGVEDVGSLFHSVFSFTFTSIAVLLILPLMSSWKSGKGLAYKAVSYISFTSYSMYLVHLAVVQVIVLPLLDEPLRGLMPGWVLVYVRYMLYWVLSFTLAGLLYTYFEQPTLRLRDRLMVKKKTQMAAQQVVG